MTSNLISGIRSYRKENLDRQINVAIIGSGIAGLAAAEQLCQSTRFNVKILEASQRIGGRIYTKKLSQNDHIDFGAQYIPCYEDNPLYRLAKENNIDLEAVPCRQNVLLASENGKSVNYDTFKEASKFYCNLFKKIKHTNFSTVSSDINDVGTYIEMKVQEYIKHMTNDQQIATFVGAMYAFMRRERGMTATNSLTDLRLRDYTQRVRLDVEDQQVTNGYSVILDKIVENLPVDIIHFNQKVEEIKWQEYKEDLYKDQSECYPVTLECANGNTYGADIVICTVPLGVLKAESKTLFKPSLPDWKSNAIERLGFGTVNKITLKYSTPFWEKTDFTYLLFWNNNDYIQHDDRRMELGKDELWLRDIIGIECVSECSNALRVAVMGDAAVKIEKLDSKSIGKSVTRLLHFFLQSDDIEEPESVLTSKWYSNSLFRGAYCYIAVNSCREDIIDLAAPLKDDMNQPLILFAGEATHDQHYSTVHGAYLSGQREAERILHTYGSMIADFKSSL